MADSSVDAIVLEAEGRASAVKLCIRRLVIAGWTGRDKAALEHHIRELEALGVKGPAQTPVFYPISPRRLSTDGRIDVVGSSSSGEVEFVLYASSQGLLVSVGSDHTDRDAEAYGITVSKQMCDKPVALCWWRFDDVAAHWDRLIVRSWATNDGVRRLYQEGPLAAMLSPLDLTREFGRARLPEGLVMFGGTLPAIGGISPSERFDFELEDPVLRRSIFHGYDIVSVAAGERE